MKKQILATLVASALMGVAQAEVTLYDYEEGTSAFEEAYVNGSLDVSKNRGDGQSAYNLYLDANYDRTISTPDRDLSFGGYVSGTVNRSSTKDADSTDTYTANASVTADNYFQPGSNGAFWYGSASAAAVDSRSGCWSNTIPMTI